jgi:hypothetical protein
VSTGRELRWSPFADNRLLTVRRMLGGWAKMASLRNLAIGRLKSLGAMNIASTTGAIRDLPERAAWILGITDSPHPSGT